MFRQPPQECCLLASKPFGPAVALRQGVTKRKAARAAASTLPGKAAESAREGMGALLSRLLFLLKVKGGRR